MYFIWMLFCENCCTVNWRTIGQMSRVFSQWPMVGKIGVQSPVEFIPKTQKMVLDTALLNIQHYKERVKWSNPGNRVSAPTTPRCGSCRKGSLRVTFDSARQPSRMGDRYHRFEGIWDPNAGSDLFGEAEGLWMMNPGYTYV